MSELNTSPPYAPPTAAPRGKLVWSLIILALLVFAIALGLLYFKWVKYREPEFEIIVAGSRHFDGAIIEIESVTRDRKLTAKFGELGRTEVPFFLPAGRYTLSATFKDGTIGPIDIKLPLPDGRKVARYELLTSESAATRPNVPRSDMPR